MNWGIIGLGHMAKNFANAINELDKTSLLGASSRSFFKLIKFGFKNKIKLKYLFQSYEDLLSCKDIENIYIGTLNNTHHNFILKCIEAGKNILCEKPFAMNLKEAENIKKKIKEFKYFFLRSDSLQDTSANKAYIEIIKRKYYWKCYKNKI